MPKRAALYLRVSTGEQTTENQRRELTALAIHRDWDVVREYEDAGISGAKNRTQRPGLDTMLKDAGRGRFDVVLVWSVDRLGRSLKDLLEFLDHMKSANVQLVMLQDGMDTTTPGGLAMWQMVAVFAQFERSMIMARIKSGMERAKAAEATGKPRYDSSGNRKKKMGKQPVPEARRLMVKQALADGVPKPEIARSCGVSLSSVHRVSRGAIT